MKRLTAIVVSLAVLHGCDGPTDVSGLAAILTMLTQPSTSAVSGAPFAQQPLIQLRSSDGEAVQRSGVAVTAAIASGAGTLGGTLTVNTDPSGVATFTNLKIAGTAGAHRLAFSAMGLESATSNPINVTIGPGAQLVVGVQPSPAAMSGVRFAQQPFVQVQDAFGNNFVSGSGVTVTASIATGGGTLGGTTTIETNSSGVAVFTDLRITGQAGPRTLQFTAEAFTPATSNVIDVTTGPGANLAVVTQPSTGAPSGTPFAQQPSIQLQDDGGNVISQSGVAVTASIASGGGTIGGMLTVTTNSAGLAVFTDLRITGQAGPRTLRFTAAGFAPAISSAIDISAGVAARLAILTQPSGNALNGAPFAQQPMIQVQDDGGNVISQSDVAVTVSLASGAGAVRGTLTVSTDAAGTATFTDLMIEGAGGPYTLTFAATGLTPVSSDVITITSGAAARLAITTQPPVTVLSGAVFLPPNQPAIQLLDTSGNLVAQPGVVVTAAVLTGPGTLGGTLTATTDASGLATFTNLMITGPSGVHRIQFASGSLAPITSATVTIAAVTVDDVVVTEGVGLLFTVGLDQAVPGGFNVDVTLADVTAAGGAAPLVSPEDYDNVVATLVFAGTAAETQQFTVATLDDAVLEASETFTVSLDASNPAVTDTDTGTGTINDNDAAAVTVEDVAMTEGTGLLFTVTLDNAVQGSFNVDVTLADVTATGGAAPLVSPEDYDNVVATLVFAGTAAETQQFTVATLDDAVLEASETFTVSLDASNPLVTDTDTGTGTINDNDAAAVTVEDVAMTEGTGLLFTVTLDNAVQGSFNVDVTLADVTATGGAAPLVDPEDYDNVVATLVFAGTAAETQQFTVATLDDAVLEGSETFTVSLDASNPLVTDTDTATGTIDDNDMAEVTVEDVSATEGAGLLFTVSLDNAVQGSFNVDVTLADVTATGGAAPLVDPEDYDNVVATLVFAGTAAEFQQFTVATLDDAAVEGAETFTVSLDASNPLVTDTDTATGMINDNDP